MEKLRNDFVFIEAMQGLKDTAYAVRNKLTHLLTELKGFKFVTTCVLEIKKEKLMIKQYITSFLSTQKQQQLLMKVILMIYLNQLILRETYQNPWKIFSLDY